MFDYFSSSVVDRACSGHISDMKLILGQRMVAIFWLSTNNLKHLHFPECLTIFPCNVKLPFGDIISLIIFKIPIIKQLSEQSTPMITVKKINKKSTHQQK